MEDSVRQIFGLLTGTAEQMRAYVEKAEEGKTSVDEKVGDAQY